MSEIEAYELGSITIHTNTPKGYAPIDEDGIVIATQISEEFKKRLADSFYGQQIVLLRTEYSFGCIETILYIGLVLTAVKQYKPVRDGLLEIAKDICSKEGLVAKFSEKVTSTIKRDDFAVFYDTELIKAIEDGTIRKVRQTDSIEYRNPK